MRNRLDVADADPLRVRIDAQRVDARSRAGIDEHDAGIAPVDAGRDRFGGVAEVQIDVGNVGDDERHVRESNAGARRRVQGPPLRSYRTPTVCVEADL